MADPSRLPAGTVEVGLRHQGRDRPYLLHAPTTGQHRAPLLLQLHGRGIGPLMFDRWTGYSALADDEGFVLAMPRAIGEVWNDGRYRGSAWPELDAVDDVGYLLAVIDDVMTRQAIDPARIYLVGMSNGATMAGRLAWEHAERISAIAQVAGTAAVDIAAEHHPAVPLPLLEIHGTRDRAIPYAGGRAGPWMRLLMRHPASPVLGVDAWAQKWIERNGALGEPRLETVPPDLTIRRWRGPSPVSDVVFCRLDGGGHSWPGARVWMPPHLGRTSRSLDATRFSWEFLSAHRGTGAR
ncbi:MAG: alpha/beta hydrolase family esterase [Candidatus Limnocylindrales bacterium]